MAERVRGWWYPYLLLGLLGVVMCVNGLMAYFATSTFNGVITDNAYEKGVNYNKTLDAARKQSDLNWSVNAQMTPGTGGHKANITLTYLDKNNHGIEGLDVQALVERPNVAGKEVRIVFTSKGGGNYAVEASLPEAGQWDFDILAMGNEATYQLQRRFVVP